MQTYQGLAASSGIAIGPLWVYKPIVVEVHHHSIEEVDNEIQRLQNALDQAKVQLEKLQTKAAETIGDEEAAIFEAHQMFLVDPEFLDTIHNIIKNEKINAEAAAQEGVEVYAQQLEMLDDEYFRARAQDVRDVGRRILYCLAGIDTEKANIQPDQPVIILAEDLTPSDTVQFEKDNVLGLCTVRGGPTSHTAILARSMGIPAVVNLDADLEAQQDGVEAILDGRVGELVIAPDAGALEDAKKVQVSLRNKHEEDLSSAHEQAVTLDGHAVEVVANIGSLADTEQALHYGAEGVGLFRTEFLYLSRDRMPSEDEQVNEYRPIFEKFPGMPVVVRTFDIGGDKDVPYIGFKDEANPFLGWRAIRMIDEFDDVLRVQFRALLRAGVDTDLRIMVPMVSRLTEVENARQLLVEAQEGLKKEGVSFAENVQFGIMIEVPSAVLIAEHVAPLIDFFSIGTNDLTQYTMAVDRTNERVAEIASPFHPSILRLISMTIEAAHEHGKWVGLCGEFAGNPLAVPLLLGLGLDEFSMSAISIPEIKTLLRKFSLEETREIAASCLKLPKATAVRGYLETINAQKEKTT
ncbi:MAG: phosphoenolpyruvate--protein phosphotransferase [Chloroflexi bacterium]|nr:MAG: phosphoenolpyruvate--protein phosphotransferase [Chloroflexota bacterium]MBL1195485.1 phosphoenolpyruvate--protein phosphotransferase [Chloroflexota bacterium]NOH12767.1 phosphoenolpyruvate--protein phosphotransferase [Chloroflexota bacterium]